MSVGLGQLFIAALSGSALPWLAGFIKRRFVRDKKAEADARKANAEAERLEWQTLRDEIERQNDQIKKLREEILSLRNTLTDREAELLRENKALHAEVGRLTRRVEGLESILRVTPLPKDMKDLLAEIDRKTAKRR